jgi:site-specific recombinase XerD
MNIEPFHVHLQKTMRNRSSQTIETYRSDLQLFGAFLSERSITEVAMIDQTLIDAYVEYMRVTENPRFGGTALPDPLVTRRLAAVSYYLEYIRTPPQPKLGGPMEDSYRKRQKDDDPKPVDQHTLDLLHASKRTSGIVCSLCLFWRPG